MRSIKPWISTFVNDSHTYSQLPVWLEHPHQCFHGILDDSVTSEYELRNLLFILCANAKVMPVISPKRTLRLLLTAWKKHFPAYMGGFRVEAGRSIICTGCCYDLNDVVEDLSCIEQLPGEPDYHSYGPNAWSGLWLGHDPNVTVIYENGYLNIFDYDPRHESHNRWNVKISFTPLEWHARSWSCLWDLYRFTYGAFREYLRKLCPEYADQLVALWCENLGIVKPPERWY